ncbi:MAG: FAD:protein FMN transferase [Phycisphaerales bacterium]|nr:FAD:protein FMN transferase [Phycisphaerales bacterium]
MSRRTAKFATIALGGLLVGLALGQAVRHRSTQTGAPELASRVEEIMATPILVETRPDQLDRAAEIVFGVFHDVDSRMSEWKDTSPLSAVNKAAGIGPVVVPADLRAVIQRGLQLGETTEGAFDITWAALWGLWDFKAEDPHPPDQTEIDARLTRIDYRRVRVDDAAGTVYLEQPGMLIGLGGIAKGAALDRAAAALREAGIEDFLLSAGGQVLGGGHRPGGDPWRIGVRDPRGPSDDYFATLTISDASISTSGDYERYFIWHGTRYHHILDPRTRWPCRGLRSVSVISADATLADGLSTGLMILGLDRGIALVESMPGVEALFVDDRGQLRTTSGLKRLLNVDHPPRAQ